MIPKSVSATSLTTAKECLARYKAENIDYARSWDNPFALLGTTLHSALQLYVERVYYNRVDKPSASMLVDFFELYFLQNFGYELTDEQQSLKDQGLAMCERWSAREGPHFDGRDILSLEEKKFFLIETSAGAIKLNYILDRFDKIGENMYEIIDYKSQNKNVRPNTMRTLTQPFVYSIAKFIEHPDAELMIVTYDMLRYDQVSIEVTKDDARRAFADIHALIEKIIATPDDNPPETLNLSCNYCIRKASCATLQKNIDVGGLFSLSLEEQIDLRTQIEMQIKGLGQLQKDLDAVIEPAIGEAEMTELSTAKSRAYFTTKQNNKIKSVEDAIKIVGPDIFYRYGKSTITLEQFGKLLKDSALTPEQVEQLQGLKIKEFSDPKLNFENKRGEEENAILAPPTADALRPAAPRAPIVGLDD